MIVYGIACLIVFALSLMDRRAMSYAFVLAVGWIVGFAGVEIWPAISLIGGVIMFALFLNNPIWWKAGICACTVPMLALDVLYWHLLAQEIYIGEEYAQALNVLFAVQLFLAGYPGARHGATRILAWRSTRLHRSHGLARDGEG